MTDERVEEQTRREWRALGFFYDCDGASKEWRLVGSRRGLLRFGDLLRAYAAEPRNETHGEHERYGPYMYLEVMTWPEPGIDEHGIRGSRADLDRLDSLVEEKVATLTQGEVARIRDGFAASAEYTLALELRDDDFDPASMDAALGEATDQHAAERPRRPVEKKLRKLWVNLPGLLIVALIVASFFAQEYVRDRMSKADGLPAEPVPEVVVRQRTSASVTQSPVSIAEGEARRLFDLGTDAIAAGNHVEAESYFRRAATIDPSSADALASLALAQQLQGRQDEAEENYWKALDLDPANTAAMVGLSTLMHGRERFQEALEGNMAALLLEPNNAVILWNIADSHYALGNFGEAREYYRRFLAVADPGDRYVQKAQARIEEIESNASLWPVRTPRGFTSDSQSKQE